MTCGQLLSVALRITVVSSPVRCKSCLMRFSAEIALTPAQAQFADGRDITLCANTTEDAVICLYSQQPSKTIRWIVDRQGHVLEQTEFRVHSAV
jgi:hypothetical protein